MKLRVEKLAKIKKAEIEIKPLTIFFGENNTNKSFMAHVVYGIYKYLPVLCTDLAYSLYYEEIDKSRALERLKTELLTKVLELFGSKKIARKRDEINIEIDNAESLIDNISRGFKDFIEKVIGIPKSYILRRFVDILIEPIDIMKFVEENYPSQVYYFPASRTGFMLAFEALISGVIRERLGVHKRYEPLTEPVVDFLDDLNKIKSTDLRVKNECVDILSNIISGEIWIDERTKEVYYHPKGKRGQQKIEMHLSSSSVVEIAPLYIFLERTEHIKNTFLVIEEPESHLHPINQIKMAEFIVALVNSGAKVLITTHSDYILSGINLCIKRFWTNRTENISKYVSPENISAYIFEQKSKGDISVEPLTIQKPVGIPFDNFYKASEMLIKEEELMDIEIRAKELLEEG